MSTIFFTGYPGFLGSELLPRILRRTPGGRAVCLVQGKFADLARQRTEELETREPDLAGRVELTEGDITAAHLGLGSARTLQAEVTQIFHLAAVYDLAVPRKIGLRVNVDGTENLLELAAGCPRLERFHYLSTCYVSGRYAGIYGEEDLDKGQVFNNFYEETKFLAEVKVQERMREGLPATIYRPSIVVGDSRTGATRKYDGPYYVLRWLLKQPRLAVLPVIGDPRMVRVNLVPVDFVIEALVQLSGLSESEGLVFQLADPQPLTVDELIDAMGRAADRRILRVPALRPVAKAAIDWVPGVHRLMGIPSPAIDYFVHPTHYRTDNTQAHLAGSGVAVPRFDTYVDRLVDFVRRHPEISNRGMS